MNVYIYLLISYAEVVIYLAELFIIKTKIVNARNMSDSDTINKIESRYQYEYNEKKSLPKSHIYILVEYVSIASCIDLNDEEVMIECVLTYTPHRT
jgi:hypothetical protein